MIRASRLAAMFVRFACLGSGWRVIYLLGRGSLLSALRFYTNIVSYEIKKGEKKNITRGGDELIIYLRGRK